MAINGLLLAGVAEEIGATRVRAPAVESACAQFAWQKSARQRGRRHN